MAAPAMASRIWPPRISITPVHVVVASTSAGSNFSSSDDARLLAIAGSALVERGDIVCDGIDLLDAGRMHALSPRRAAIRQSFRRAAEP